MRINILGQSSVLGNNGIHLHLEGGKPQVLLSYLALQANRAVDVDQLVDVLWGGVSPASTAANLQTYASRIRRLLETAETGGSRRLKHLSGAYRLHLEPHECDVLELEQLSRASLDALGNGRFSQARALSERAAQIPYGPIFPASALERSLRLTGHMRRVEEFLLAALEVRARLALAEERGKEILADLRQAVAEFPLRECLHKLLILALCQASEFGPALMVYQEARRVFSDHLGVEPGPDLRELYSTLLQVTAASADAQARGHDGLQQSLRKLVPPVRVPRQPNPGPWFFVH